MELSSFDSSTAFEFIDDVKLPLAGLDQLFAPSEKHLNRLIPPTTYQLQRDGWGNNARVWALSPSSSNNHPKKSSSLIIDASPTFNPITAVVRGLTSDSKNGSSSGESVGFHVIDPAVIPPTHCIRKVTGRTYALFEGPGDHDEYSHARKVMNFQLETCFGSTSTYTQPNGASQHAIMHKVEGLNPWWSVQRTLDDFEGVRYSCKTEPWSGDITLTRLSDQTAIAKFVRAKFSWTVIGVLSILEPLEQNSLNLVLSSIYIKYLRDRERRQSSSGG